MVKIFCEVKKQVNYSDIVPIKIKIKIAKED
jgi:hypothetical protein